MAAPVFDPPGGSHNDLVTVTITSATAGATIYYTVDGTDPTVADGVEYDSPLELDETTTLKAIAVKAGDTDSPITSATYTVVDTSPAVTVADPVFTPAAGTYPDHVQVTLTCATPGSTIYYTTDGSDPTTGNPNVYDPSEPLDLLNTATVKAFATADSDDTPSAVVTATYTVTHATPVPTVATPVFTPAAGSFNDFVSVTLTCETPGATIYYTTDGSTPTTDSLTFDPIAPLEFEETTTVKAFAAKPGNNSSAVVTGTFTVVDTSPAVTVADPVFAPAAGTYPDHVQVTLTCATPGSTIYYTTDGSNPTTESPMYDPEQPLDLINTTTVKAFATADSDDTPSAVVTATYTVTHATPVPTVATPVFTPTAGSFNDFVSVILTCETPGATIYYTMDGSTPTTDSLTFDPIAPLEFDETTTVKAFAAKPGNNSSAVVTGTFTVVDTSPPITVANPVFAPAPGTYPDHVQVTLTCATPGSTIYYTTDGTDPKTGSPEVYDPSEPLELFDTATVKAYATADSDDTPSAVVTATYTVTHATPVPTVAIPVFTPAAGSFNDFVSVTLTCATPGATIYYTTDGSTPTTDSLTFDPVAPLEFEETTTVKAFAAKPGNNSSAVVTATFTVTDTSPPVIVANPVFAPAAGTYPDHVQVTLTCATPDSTIWYTTDGTDPKTGNPEVYDPSEPLELFNTTTVKAYATGDNDDTDSAVVTATYTVTHATPLPTVATPVFTPAAGSYNNLVSVKLTSSTPGAAIYYTLDGSTPTKDSDLFFSDFPLELEDTTTVKAIAIKLGFNDSAVATGTFTVIDTTPPITVANPSFSPNGGTFNDHVTVTMSCPTSGATIYYTTDGTTPDADTGYEYDPDFPLELEDTTTVKAIATADSDDTPSAVISATFTIIDTTPAITVANPVFTPGAGSYNDFVSVALSCATPGATIWYTTDGTTPTVDTGFEYDPEYPLEFDETTTVKAFATKDSDDTPSAVVTAVYTVIDTTPAIKVATPVISPASGAYNDLVTLTITCSTPDATIYYTIDGSTPSEDNGEYYDEFTPPQLASDATVKAIAVRKNDFDSDIATASYTVIDNPPITVAAPKFNPRPGRYYDSVEVSLSCSTPGATIYYTIDGTDPIVDPLYQYYPEFTEYVFETETIKAIAVRPGDNDSPISSAKYTILPLPPPKLKLVGPKKRIVTKPTVIIRGTSTFADEIDYTVGKSKAAKKAKGVKSWKIKVRVKPGKNTIGVFGVGLYEDSKPIKITVIYTPPGG